MARFYLKCGDCLQPVAVDLANGYDYGTRYECGACGGRLGFMGRVVGDQWVKTDMLCKCDGRCVNALGPSCDCQCGGANHGAGVLGYVETVVASGVVRVVPPHVERARLVAEQFRAQVAAVRSAIERMPKGYGAESWERQRAENKLRAARSMKIAGDRSRRLSALLAEFSPAGAACVGAVGVQLAFAV